MQQYSMRPGVAKAYMQSAGVASSPAMIPHDLVPLTTPFYLVSVENLNTGMQASDYVKDLSKWYVRFLLKPIFHALDTITDPVFIKLTPPLGVFSTTIWKKQGVCFRTTVSYASDVDANGTTDQVNVYVRSPPLQISHVGLTENCPDTLSRTRQMISHACARLIVNQGFQKLPDPPAVAPDTSLDEHLALLSISHGDAMAPANNASIHAYGGQFDTHTREDTVASTVLPMVLRQLFFLQDLVDETTCTPYCIYAVNPFAYMLLLPNLGGWTVCVQVNMLARIDAVLQLFSLLRVDYAMLPSQLQVASNPPHMATVSRYKKTLTVTRRALEAEFRASAGTSISKVNATTAKALTPPRYTMYLAYSGIFILLKNAHKLYYTLMEVQERNDANRLVRELFIVKATPHAITSDAGMRVVVVRSALNLLKGNVLRWMRDVHSKHPHGTARKDFINLVLRPASTSVTMWPSVDKATYDSLAVSLRRAAPSVWSHHLIRLMPADVDAEKNLAHLLFFADEVFPFIPAHIKCPTIADWQTLVTGATALDETCNEFFMSAGHMTQASVDNETMAMGLAFLGLIRGLTPNAIQNTLARGAV